MSSTANWAAVFLHNKLPIVFDHCLKLHEPFFYHSHCVRIVTSIEPYLKRQRDDEDDA